MPKTPSSLNTFVKLLHDRRPNAYAHILGGAAARGLEGIVYFYKTPFGGIFIEVEVNGLPHQSNSLSCGQFYGMHIHETGDCSDNFAKTGSHYNPLNALHPDHAGDLPPLLGNQGYAYMTFYTCRLQISDIVGRSYIIHASPDDLMTQPAGNSGEKIACGVIQAVRNC